MKKQHQEATDLVMDSTGLKVYGEGEWKVRLHGANKRRTWRKYHVSIDLETQEVSAVKLTQSNVHDSQVFDELTGHEKKINKTYGDGAYFTTSCFDVAVQKEATHLAPVRSGT